LPGLPARVPAPWGPASERLASPRARAPLAVRSPQRSTPPPRRSPLPAPPPGLRRRRRRRHQRRARRQGPRRRQQQRPRRRALGDRRGQGGRAGKRGAKGRSPRGAGHPSMRLHRRRALCPRASRPRPHAAARPLRARSSHSFSKVAATSATAKAHAAACNAEAAAKRAAEEDHAPRRPLTGRLWRRRCRCRLLPPRLCAWLPRPQPCCA
jgi:hypothetical protein